jgi:hypothetical protein
MVHYGRKMFHLNTYNTYIPVKHTIMKKPNLHDNFNDDLQFQFGKTFDRLAINPVLPHSPLKGFKMGNPSGESADRFLNQSYKPVRFRKLSHI